jgi:hypothetical protein
MPATERKRSTHRRCVPDRHSGIGEMSMDKKEFIDIWSEGSDLSELGKRHMTEDLNKVLSASEARAAQLQAERDGYAGSAKRLEQQLDALRLHHSKIIMALYEIDHDTFGPLTSIEGIAELKRQRDELSDNLNRALNGNRAMIGKLEKARAELHFFHGAFPQATRNYKALSECESETPFGQALDGMGDEVQG